MFTEPSDHSAISPAPISHFDNTVLKNIRLMLSFEPVLVYSSTPILTCLVEQIPLPRPALTWTSDGVSKQEGLSRDGWRGWE